MAIPPNNPGSTNLSPIGLSSSVTLAVQSSGLTVLNTDLLTTSGTTDLANIIGDTYSGAQYALLTPIPTGANSVLLYPFYYNSLPGVAPVVRVWLQTQGPDGSYTPSKLDPNTYAPITSTNTALNGWWLPAPDSNGNYAVTLSSTDNLQILDATSSGTIFVGGYSRVSLLGASRLLVTVSTAATTSDKAILTGLFIQ